MRKYITGKSCPACGFSPDPELAGEWVHVNCTGTPLDDDAILDQVDKTLREIAADHLLPIEPLREQCAEIARLCSPRRIRS